MHVLASLWCRGADYSSNTAFLSPFNACALVVVNLANPFKQMLSQLQRWLAQINACGLALDTAFPAVVVATHSGDAAPDALHKYREVGGHRQ
jgi:hypothetical protein